MLFLFGYYNIIIVVILSVVYIVRLNLNFNLLKKSFGFVHIFLMLSNMTSKEFQRKCKAFASLDAAAGCFRYPIVKSVLRLVMIYIDGTKYETYVSHVNVSDMDFDFCNSIWFDRFYRYEFDIQVKFFKSFLQKLTKYQLDIIHADKRFSNLFNYLSNERKK